MPFKFRDLLKFGKMSTDKRKEGGEGTAKPVTCVLIGAGNRGFRYAFYAVAFPQDFKIVGVADPRDFYRKRVQNEHDIPDKFAFQSWTEAAEKEKFADCVIIATTDRLHKDPAVAFAKKGYHILLEKPMAVSEDDCREIASTCKSSDVLLAVCHVMRYLPWVCKAKEIIDSGEIGQVVNIQHTEPIGFWHFAHSYVRGNWHKESLSSCSLLAKCCHDVDLIKYWMEGAGKCMRVSSFGSLAHFRKEDKPEGAGSRCLDCSIEQQCPYSAKRLYLDFVKEGHTGWPVEVVAEEPDIESVTEALKTGPYGRCVYQSDNDVMSQQVATFQFESGATASLTMVAFTSRLCSREVRIYGTKGEIRCDGGFGAVEVFDFLTQNTRQVPLSAMEEKPPGRLRGHSGADYRLMKAFVSALKTGNKELIRTGADDTLGSHLLVFAAEKARKENCVVHIQPDGSF
ncbi:putative oxidoreductase YteT isoform X1 [Babylonia areolata]|uniref:putative oxidoreductase YteT isoform X1 n=2 Tax=Babylonia areolata TaxID=304850 RepID=UPI003FD3441F